MSKPQDILDVAVVGAGMAGLSCARALADAGRHVTVFDKSRGVGGRMATRRSEQGSFDHGAQYFTAHDPAFMAHVDAWQHAGAVAEWQGRLCASSDAGVFTPVSAQPRYVGTPRMSALGRTVLADVPHQLGERLTALQHNGDHWQLSFESNLQVMAQNVVLALPAPQLADLFEPADTVHQLACSVQMLPTWSVMLTLDQPLALDFDGCFVNAGPLSWVANNSSKPERQSTHSCWVLHASSAWSQAHVDDSPAQVQAALLEAFASLIQQPIYTWPAHTASAHRWLYALADQPLTVGCTWDATRRLGITGDWLNGSRVEGAWLSGADLARQMLNVTPDHLA